MAPRSKIRTSRCSWRGLSLLGRPGENRTLRASAPRRRHAFRQRITELAAHLIRRATSFRDNFSPRSFSARLRRSESSSAEPLGRIETSFRQEVYYIALFCVRPIGFELTQATVAKYLVRHRKPPSQNWRTFLINHMQSLVSADFFVVPTITFRLLFVFVILSHDRRRPIHFAITANPTAEWTTRQLLQAFPWDSAPRYLLRDRDACYGEEFHKATGWLGIREVLTAPRSPWQNPYVERLIGSIRRECLDHVIVLNEPGLRRVLKSYFEYYERCRTHLSLDKDAPIPRKVQPPELGKVVELPQVGGLHHRYERRAA